MNVDNQIKGIINELFGMCPTDFSHVYWFNK